MGRFGTRWRKKGESGLDSGEDEEDVPKFFGCLRQVEKKVEPHVCLMVALYGSLSDTALITPSATSDLRVLFFS